MPSAIKFPASMSHGQECTVVFSGQIMRCLITIDSGDCCTGGRGVCEDAGD